MRSSSPLLRSADDDPRLRQSRVVERVERIPEREHDVVRHVDDIRDRPHAGVAEPRPQPRWRRPDHDVPKEAADVAGGPVEVLDPDVEALVSPALFRVFPRRRCELEAVERGYLAGDSVHGEQIRTVPGRLQDQDVLGEGELVRERRARLPLVGQQHDPGVVDAELDLVLREDHSVRELAAQLCRLELAAVGQHSTG